MKSAALAAFLLAGCAFDGLGQPSDSRAEIRIIAIMPFRNATEDARFDGTEMANILALEVAKTTRLRAIRPHELREFLDPGDDLTRVDDSLRAARRAKVQAILALKVTDLDPYDPPRIALSVQLLLTESRALSEAQIDAIAGSASWKRGAFALPREKAGHGEEAFEIVYDAREEQTRRKLVSYARGHAPADSPLLPEQEYLAVQSRYLQFVSSDLLSRLFERPASE